MKTTIEVPDALFRRAKSKAAERGQKLKDFFTEAIQDKLAQKSGGAAPPEAPWMQGFGKLKRLAQETRRIQARIDREFQVIEPEDRM